MDRDALVEVAIREASYTKDYRTRGTVVLAEAAIAALGANGYVVVPRHLLDELAVTSPASNGKLYTEAIAEVRAAVVEAVGPTTPLNRWPDTGEPMDQVGT